MKTLTLNYYKEFDLDSLSSICEPQKEWVKNLWDKFVDNGHKVFVDENEIYCCLEDDFFIFIKEQLPSIDESTINDEKVLDKYGNEIFIPKSLLKSYEEVQ
mgnify:CR=1 FL=1